MMTPEHVAALSLAYLAALIALIPQAGPAIEEFAGSTSTDLFQGSVVLAGMVIAWRLMTKAHRDSIQAYKDAAEDDTVRLARERSRWDEERKSLIQERNDLAREIFEMRRNGRKSSG